MKFLQGGLAENLFKLLLVVFGVLMCLLVRNIVSYRQISQEHFRDKFEEVNRLYGYEWPQLTDLWVSLLAGVISVIIEKSFIKLTWDFIKKRVKPYDDAKVRDLKVHKACLCLHGTFYYAWVVVYGYKVLL